MAVSFTVVVFAETVPLIIPRQTEREELLREDKGRETGNERKGEGSTLRYGMRKKGEGGGVDEWNPPGFWQYLGINLKMIWGEGEGYQPLGTSTRPYIRFGS